MQTASSVATPKRRAAKRASFVGKPRPASSASVVYVRSDSEPEPTEPDIPIDQAWFKDRPDIIDGIKRGLADMAAGRGIYLGSFAEYAELEDDEN